MRVSYKGYEIEATRDPEGSGEQFLTWSIFRESDDYECASGFQYCDETEATLIEHMKVRVDAEEKSCDPWGEALAESYLGPFFTDPSPAVQKAIARFHARLAERKAKEGGKPCP